MNCPICGAEDIKYKYSVYDDRYGYPGEYELYSCNSCSHIYLLCELSENDFSNLYSKYYPRSTFSLEDYKPYEAISGLLPWFNGINSRAHAWVPEKVKILDIGCGFCQSIGYHERRDCEVHGVEVDKNVLPLVKNKNFNVKIGFFNPDDYTKNYFDYITLDQVIEHIKDPHDLFRGLSEILKENGKIVITTPNAASITNKLFQRKWVHWHAPYHLHFYSKNSINAIANKNGLYIDTYSTSTGPNWLLYQWLHLLFYPVINHPSGFWVKNEDTNFSKKVIKKIIQVLHLLKVNHVLIKIFDRFNIGDNTVYILTKKR